MDKLTLVIVFLGTTLVGVVLGVVVLTALNTSVPDILSNLGVGALAALAGLLVQSNRNAGDTTDYNVNLKASTVDQ